uniref:Coiled-coil domain-containing protein 25 n=1 Tax=Syphacia muris TaxID=451379 RepID=A0A0N5AM44_9BILA
MVIKFKSTVVDPPALLYMGVDKNENEHLIRWGWPEDVWFHVDKLSSAHVYVRLRKGQTIDDMPQSLIDDCAQLVKEHSIQGCKLNNVDVVYTPWENLKKTGEMDVGQVGFKDDSKVRKVHVAKKLREIINRLHKTEVHEDIDYRAEREERDAKERRLAKQRQREMKERELKELEAKERERKIRNYDGMFDPNKMQSNEDAGNLSDDFM